MSYPTLLTPTQQRILVVLQDGLMHTQRELHACLSDELQPAGNVSMHLVGMRRYLQPDGKSIACTRIDHVSYYQLVRTIATEE